MTMDHHNNHLKLEITETFHASNAIQLRTHPPHTTINFSELGKKLLESARYGDTDVVLELINSGAPFTTDWLGASPLHYAAQYGNVETVETLLRSGIAKDARTKIDRTALHIAAQEGSLETATVLVNFGCDVDAKDMLRMTPLHWAVQRGHRDIVELLLNNGADVRIVNKFDKTPIDVAYSCGHDDFVPLLKSFLGKVRPKVNPIDSAIQIKLMKNQSKNRSKILNSVRNMNKLSSPQQQQSIKQELDEEIRHISSSASSDGFNPISTSSNTSNKIIITKRTSIDSNQLQNGQTIAGSGKLIVNNNSISSNFGSNNSQKIYTFNPSNSNLVLLSSSSGGSGTIGGGNKINDGSSSGSIKVMTTVGSNMKKPVFTEIKDVKTLEKLQFFNASNKNGRGVSGGSGGGQPQIIKRLVINPNQATAAAMNSSLIQEKDSEIARLKEENQKLRNDCDEMRNLIISKDLEIERLKKMKTVHHSTTTKTTNVTSNDTHEDAMNDNNTIDTNDQQLVSSIPPSSNSPPTIELEDDEQLD